MHCACGNHHLQTRSGFFVAYIFHIIHRFVFLVGDLYFLDKLIHIGIIAETDEGLGVMTCLDYIITFVLTSELIEIFPVILFVGMTLHGHVAGAVIGIVIIEADGEITAEFIGTLPAHHLFAGCHEECLERKLHLVPPHFDHDAHLHRDKIEHPCAITHVGGQVSEFLHISASPYTFKINRFCTKRV